MGEDAKSFMIGDFLFPWTKKDATWNPRPSGLLGPVRLIPLQETCRGGWLWSHCLATLAGRRLLLALGDWCAA